MSKFRFASTVSLVALTAVVAGCAMPQRRAASASSKPSGEVGLATLALAAINSNNFASAVSYAERAVEKTPGDADFRALLANAYFGAGRFASAETAYKDLLTISPNQPQAVLKLALVEIAQGKRAEALALLESARRLLDPTDYGLAVALAGQPREAIFVLEAVARMPGADARARQNLALAYALSGDWLQARTIAGQDLPANQLDARIRHWIQLANPRKTYDQVAALTGIAPAAVDPGQPTRLALRRAETLQAQAAPVAVPQPQVAMAAPPPPPPPPAALAAPAPQFANVVPAPPVTVAPAPPPPNPARVPAAKAAPAPVSVAAMAAASPEAPAAFAAFAPKRLEKPPVSRASVTVKLPPVRNATLRRGKSSAVVQLGAYGSRERVSAAWDAITKRHPALRAYLPMTARFDSSRGTVYRLSVKGFTSQQEAIARCHLLKRRGGNCFVRNVAGDAPIQIASR